MPASPDFLRIPEKFGLAGTLALPVRPLGNTPSRRLLQHGGFLKLPLSWNHSELNRRKQSQPPRRRLYLLLFNCVARKKSEPGSLPEGTIEVFETLTNSYYV